MDDEACEEVLPELRLFDLCGWRVLLQHIVNTSAKVGPYNTWHTMRNLQGAKP